MTAVSPFDPHQVHPGRAPWSSPAGTRAHRPRPPQGPAHLPSDHNGSLVQTTTDRSSVPRRRMGSTPTWQVASAGPWRAITPSPVAPTVAMRRSKTSGTAPLCAITVLPIQVVWSRMCRCTPCETSRALICRASRIRAALPFAADSSLKPVYFCAQNLGGRAHLPTARSPALPRVRVRALPGEPKISRQRTPQAHRRLAPRALYRLRGNCKAHGPGADEGALRTTRAAGSAARQRPWPGG